MRRERLGILAAVLSSSLGGTNTAVTRFAIGASDPMTLAALLAAVLLGEPVGATLVVGVIGVAAGLRIASTDRRARRRNPDPVSMASNVEKSR